jgi:site-specific DNA-methyltransferase (adenine-specific)
LSTRENQIVLDPFMGSGTTALAAKLLDRNFIGFEINSTFHKKSIERLEAANEDSKLESSLSNKLLFNY